MSKPLVILESPLAANVDRTVEEHIHYAKACMRDSLLRGEAPFASHLLYAQHGILDDLIKDERLLGIEAGLEWGKVALVTAVYTDCGISTGMKVGIERAAQEGREVVYRTLDFDWAKGSKMSDVHKGRIISDKSTLTVIPEQYRVLPTTEAASAHSIAVGASIGAMLARISELEALLVPR